MSELARQLITENKRSKAKSLDLGNCGLTDLEKQVPELFECVWLEELNLGELYWNERGVDLVKTKNNGKKNFLNDKVAIVTKLSKLKRIHLNLINLENASFLLEFSKLTILTLTNNELSNIHFLEKLEHLEVHLARWRYSTWRGMG